jgi:hypothetical protein
MALKRNPLLETVQVHSGEQEHTRLNKQADEILVDAISSSYCQREHYVMT